MVIIFFDGTLLEDEIVPITGVKLSSNPCIGTIYNVINIPKS